MIAHKVNERWCYKYNLSYNKNSCHVTAHAFKSNQGLDKYYIKWYNSDVFYILMTQKFYCYAFDKQLKTYNFCELLNELVDSVVSFCVSK